MRAITSLVDRVTGATGLIGAWAVAPLIICSCYEVVARYVFDSPTMWAFELGYMLTGANFLLGMAYALREHAHIRIEIFYQYFSPRLQALIDVLTYLVIVVPICAWLSWGLYEYALNAYLNNESSGMSAWNPPIWPFRVTFALGFIALMLQALAELIRASRILCTGIVPSSAPSSAPAPTDELHNYPTKQAEAL